MSKTNVEQGGTTVHLYIHTVRGGMHDIVQLYSVNYSDGHGWNYMVHFAMTLYYQSLHIKQRHNNHCLVYNDIHSLRLRDC